MVLIKILLYQYDRKVFISIVEILKTSMPKTLPQIKIAQIFKQYMRNPNNTFIAEKLDLHPATVAKYIKSENMEDRRKRVLAAASERMIEKQGEQLAYDIMDARELKDLTVESLISRIENGSYEPSIADMDRLQRLIGHLLQMPSVIVEHRDASIEVQRVKRTDIIDAEYKTDEPEN